MEIPNVVMGIFPIFSTPSLIAPLTGCSGRNPELWWIIAFLICPRSTSISTCLLLPFTLLALGWVVLGDVTPLIHVAYFTFRSCDAPPTTW